MTPITLLRTRSTFAAGVASLLAATLVAAPTATASADAPTAQPAAPETTTVTLITGDVVTYEERDGEPVYSVDATARDGGTPVTFLSQGDSDDFYVYPSDVTSEVLDGSLDRELFNIPGLVRQGLDDDASDGVLPVIVTFDHDRTARELSKDADALPATTAPRAVEPVNGAGIDVNLRGADRFREAVLEAPRSDVDRVVLDRVLTVNLDESVPQIGAPTAWEAGYTGEGITVGVLDTGVDATHPDLAGKVVAAKDFTGEGTTDLYGHGTHVASTIAGTGAASDGRYVGVAPDADLISGKVCDAEGQCQTSDILAGMAWAAGQADIINMSLGEEFASDGSDVLSQLVDDLTAETGTLFVTSAGNAGPAAGTVSAPAAAASALAVGAVDKSDVLAGFSSRGLRAGDFMVKPEITAPGVDIVAARASGTTPPTPVGEYYTSASGTSMAAPHVAGAAALLAQAHPGLSGTELKDALTSTAFDGGYRVWEQGTGRVDVARAVEQGVYGSASLNLGDLTAATAPVTDDLVYTNTLGSAVTLRLDVAATDESGRDLSQALTLSTETTTVPAGGQATVTVTVDPAAISGSGYYGGVVTATADGVHLRTAVGFGRADSQEADFSPSSTTWTSPSTGWVLGWVDCGDTLCGEIRRTTDGGKTWSQVNAPDLHPSEYGEQTRIFFAEHGRHSVGLITDRRQLWSTFDGGATWRPEDLGVDAIVGIDATKDAVYAAGLIDHPDSTVTTQVFNTRINKRRWTPVRGLEATAASSSISSAADVAAQGHTVQASTFGFGRPNRVWTSTNGHRYHAASPCDEWSTVHVGVADAGHQFALCSFDPGRGYMQKQLMSTTDGEVFTPVAMAPPTGITSDFAVADESTIAIGSTGGDAGFVLMSFDGGTTWEVTLAEPDTGPVFDLDFQDASHGTLVAGYPTLGTSKVFRTSDGGHTWARVRFE